MKNLIVLSLYALAQAGQNLRQLQSPDASGAAGETKATEDNESVIPELTEEEEIKFRNTAYTVAWGLGSFLAVLALIAGSFYLY